MELRTFVRRQSTVMLVLIPLLVGAAAAVFFGATQTRPFEASTTLALGEALDSDPEAFGFSGRVDDFIFTVESRTVTALVRDDVGIPDGETGGELSAAPVGNGGLVEVSHTADDADTAVEGLRAGIGAALAALANERLDNAANQVEVVDEQIELLNARLAELEGVAGGPDVANRYRDVALEVQTLETMLAQNAGVADFDAEAVTARVGELTSQRDALATVVNEWEQVKSRLEQLGEGRQTVELERLAAQGVVDQAVDDDRFFATIVSRPSVLQIVALPAMAAAVAAFGVVLGASMLRERGRVSASARPATVGARRPAPANATRDARSPGLKAGARPRVGSNR